MNLQVELELVASCDLCGHEVFFDLFVSKGWQLVRCAHCDLAMVSPRPTARSLHELGLDAFAAAGSDDYRSKSLPPRPAQLDLVRELSVLAASMDLSPRRRALVVGCGDGQLVEAFDRQGWKAVGLESSRRACSAATAVGRHVVCGNLESAQFEPQSFAAIAACNILERVHYPSVFLERCSDLLEPRGLLVVEVPNFACPASRAAGPHWNRLDAGASLHQFTRRTLTAYLQRTGLRPLRWSRSGGRGFLGSGPAEHTLGNPESLRFHGHADAVRSWLFDMRAAVYWIPGVREAVRWAVWQLLGYGETLRVIACRE